MKKRCLSCPLFRKMIIEFSEVLTKKVSDRERGSKKFSEEHPGEPDPLKDPEHQKIIKKHCEPSDESKKGLDALFDTPANDPAPEPALYRHKCVKCGIVRSNRFANGQTCSCGSAMDSNPVKRTGKKYRRRKTASAKKIASMPATPAGSPGLAALFG